MMLLISMYSGDRRS